MSKYKRPSEKRDIVGIFCRTYTCSEAIEKFLSEFFSGRLDIWGDGLPNKSVEWTFGVITEQ